MKHLHKIVFTVSILAFVGYGHGQTSTDQFLYKSAVSPNSKPAFDLAAIDSWPVMTNEFAVSDNGKYMSYSSYCEKEARAVVKSTDGKWQYAWPNWKIGVFSGDSRWYAYRSGDSLYMLELGESAPKFAGLISSYKTNQTRNNKNAKIDWLAWQLKGTSKTVVLHHFATGKEERMEGVNAYDFEDNGRWLVCRMSDGGLLLHSLSGQSQQRFSGVVKHVLDKASKILVMVVKKDGAEQVQVVDLSSGKVQTVWEGAGTGAIAMDAVGKQLAFIVTKKQGQESNNSIWYWSNGMAEAEERLHNGSQGIKPGLFIGNQVGFVADDKYLSFQLEPAADRRKPLLNAAKVDIWHYADTQVQSVQLLYGSRLGANGIPWLEPRRYFSVFAIRTGIVEQLGNEYFLGGILGNYGFQRRNDSRRDPMDSYPKDSVWMVFFKEGVRRYLGLFYWNEPPRLSKGGRYLIWFDRDIGHYFTYEIATGRRVNISGQVPVYVGSEMKADPKNAESNFETGILGWLEEDAGLLIYDSYDIWQLDPAGRKAAVNLTRGYGRRHGIRLRLTKGGGNKDYEETPVAPGDELLLTAVDTVSFENGFFRQSLKHAGDPVKLFIGPYALDWTPSGISPLFGGLPGRTMSPLKARDADVWIVRRQSATEAPNYFVTRDLKLFLPLSDIRPQQGYNWLTKEMVRFRQVDGTMSRGLLYKPQNFDPSKKYPVIIQNYFQFSQLLHEFPDLEYTKNAVVNIPWLVSRGYLVFTPDTWFTMNRPRPASAWNTVEGAARYLKSLPYVDGSRMAVAGHSRGGGYTNYIITHSRKFAAAFEGAGVSNWVSAQHTLGLGDGVPRSARGQEPFVYTNKSFMGDNPILHADEITSPLLIFHNREDRAVPWEQAIELYIAMRRLSKRVWMLQYDGESHSLSEKKNEIDLTIRMTQFFDHYLKGAPPPVWMTRGIKASLKGIELGYELDRSGKKP